MRLDQPEEAYVPLSGVPPTERVGELLVRWRAALEPAVRPSRCEVWLVPGGALAEAPTAAQEAAATPLSRYASLAAAGVVDGAALLGKQMVAAASDEGAAGALAQAVAQLSEQLRAQSALSEQLRAQNAQLGRLLPMLFQEAQRARVKRLDPWTSAHRTKIEQAAFKQSLLMFYARREPDTPVDPPWARCMASGAVLPAPLVKAAHIWKHATGGDGLEEFGLKPLDVHSSRNGLLLASQLEAAFGVKRIAFRYDVLHDAFRCRVLDPALKGTPTAVVSDAELASLRGYAAPAHVPLVSDVDSRLLQRPADAIPFRRLLAWHYAVSVKHAAAMGWVSAEEDDDAQAEARTWLDGSPPAAWLQLLSAWPGQMHLYDHAAARSAREGASDSDE